MSLLYQIQESVVQEGSNLGSILLKLRLLAARLGSEVLEEWVKYESEGYPKEAELPDYRVIDVRYRGTFSGPFGSGIRNAQIPLYIIEKYAGENWVNYKMRESISAVDELVKKGNDGYYLGIDASNLVLLLHGKVYKGYACNDVTGTISHVSLSEIQQAVRSKVLELTLEFEKSIPTAMDITFGASGFEKTNLEKIQQISQQIIYGNVATAIAGGHGTTVTIAIEERDKDSLIDYLKSSGIPEVDAVEFTKIVESEEPTSVEEPFGREARNWVASNLKKAAEGTWKIGVSVATKVLTEAVLKYYGLK